MLNMGSRSKALLAFLALLIVSISLIFLLEFSTTEALTNPFFSQPTSLAQSTPYKLSPPPSTIAPSENYSIPPLTSLNLKIRLTPLPEGWSTDGFVYIKGGSGNDINFRIIDQQGKIILDLGRISNGTSFHFQTDKPGNFTIILDNEFSVFSSKEVEVFSYDYPELAGFSINFWVIIPVVILLVTLMALVVWLIRRKHK